MRDSSPPPGSSPARRPEAPSIDRAALERVLTRAAELQSATGETPEQISEAQLLEVGKEVGLSAQHLRQALAEERTRSLGPTPERGVAASLLGLTQVHAARVVPGSAPAVLSAIDSWMQREELLQVKRQMVDRIVWEPRRDLLGAVRRALNVGGRGYALTRAEEIGATVIAVDEQRVHVSLSADLRSHRSRLTGQLAGTTVLGAAATGVLTIMGVAGAIAVIPVVLLPAGGVYALRALQAGALSRAQLALEQVLDRLEAGPAQRPPSLLGAIADAATRPRGW